MHKALSHLSRALASIVAGFFAVATLCVAAIPSVHAAPGVRANVTYQARLMDASGYPVADGTYQVRFSLYDSAVAGTRLWTASGTTAVPTTVDVSVQDGLFTVLLGDGVTQLPFTGIDWNSDTLYLGVTIGADGEMSPRRPITAVPQAINSAQLSGMSASGTDTYGGESQFTITQASTTAATSTRSALDVRSNGTSLTNDFILRAITSTGTPAFTITSQGVVSTTNLLVAGQNVCLADGTDCLPVAAASTTLQDAYDNGNSITLTNNPLTLDVVASGTDVIGFPLMEGYTALAIKGFGQGGVSFVQASSSVVPTTTFMFFTSDINNPLTATSSYIASQPQAGILQISAANEFGLDVSNAGNLSLQTLGGVILLNANTTTFQGNIFINGGAIQGNVNPFTDNAYSLGNASFRWNGYFTGVTTTYLSVNGQSVCLANGTNCANVSLGQAYNNGNTVTTTNGAIHLVGASTTLIGSDVYSHLITGTFTSGTNEGFDLSLFASSSNPYLAGTGTTLIYREDRTQAPGFTTSSGIGFSSDDSQNYLTLFSVRPGGQAQNVTFNRNGITVYPSAGATTTFAQNVALEYDARVDSSLVPRYDANFELGTSTNRWNANLYSVTSTYVHIASELGAAPYYGSMLINTAAQGVASGLDIISLDDPTFDGSLLVYRQDRTTNDHAQILMGQSVSDGYHKISIEAAEGGSSNALLVTPTSTTAGGDVNPLADNSYWLGSVNYRWNGYFNTVSTTNLFVNGQSVCLADGTNCLTGGTSSDWTFNASNGMTRLTTTTNDVVIGSAATSTGAPVYVETNGQTGTSTLFVGYNTSSNVIIGGTSSTFDFMHPDYAAAFDGNDLFVGGNIGSASSIYTNGEFVVGNASMHIGNGYITKTDGDLSLSSLAGDIVVSAWNGNLKPSTDLGVSLGSATERFNGNFGSLTVQQLNATNSNVYNSSIQRLDYFKTNLQQAGTLSFAALSGATTVRMDINDHQVAIAAINGTSGGVKVFHTHVQGSSVLNDTSFTIAKPFIRDIAISRNRLYLLNAATNQLEIHGYTSVSDTGMIGSVGGFDFSTSSAIVIKGNYAYIGDVGKLRVVDISNDTNPRIVFTTIGTISLGTYDMAVDGHWLVMAYEYILGGVRSYRFNISNPLDITGPSFDLASINPTIGAQDGTMYTIETGGTFVTSRSIENPGGNLYLGCFIADANQQARLSVSGQYVFTAGQDLNVVNAETCESAHMANAGATGSVDVAATGYHVYVASTNGITAYDFGGFRSPAADFGEMRIGNAFVSNDLDVYGQGYFGRGLQVAAGGATINDGLTVEGSMEVNLTKGTIQINGGTSGTNMYPGGAANWYSSMNFGLIGATNTGLAITQFTTNTSPTTTALVFSTDLDSPLFATTSWINFDHGSGDLQIASNVGGSITIARSGGVTMTATTGTISATAIEFNGFINSNIIPTTSGKRLGQGGQLWNGMFEGVTSTNLYSASALVGDSSVTGTANYAMVIGYASSATFGGLCIDDSLTPATCPASTGGTSIAADGTIMANAFDLAETYESPDALEPGDIVVASAINDLQVVRSSDTTTLPMGIVSSQPGLQLGFSKEGAHPIALAGRVPTKVSTINGEIKPGDLLAPTQIPGVAGKATEDGPIVGIALQGYNGNDIGKIEVFVKTSWYSKPNNAPQVVQNNTYVTNVTSSTSDIVRRGLAKIEAGATKVHITFASLNGYPFVQVTPRGLIVGSWSTDNYTDTGFDIILEQPQTFDAAFSWEARAIDGSTMMLMSDGTSLLVDPTTGQVILQDSTTTPDVPPTTPVPTDPVPTSTDPVPPTDPLATSTSP